MSNNQSYSTVLRVAAVREILLISTILRIPMWAANVVLVLHVVDHLGRTYTAAGVLGGVATVAGAVSGPWRGRRLDRIGLRRTMLPSLVVLTVVWSIAPFLDYWWLLALAALGALFLVPSFSIVRQVLITAVDSERRKTALALDSVLTEVSFMIGPVIGVLLATSMDTRWALLICEFAAIAMAFVLYLRNPRLVHPEDQDHPTQQPTGRAGLTWLTPYVVTILLVSATATFVLTGGDLGVVAAMRDMGTPGLIGWTLAAWGLGSAIGGLVYGALPGRTSPFTLVGLLGLTSLPVAFATTQPWFIVAMFVTGLFCAPTITATIELLTDAVPARNRGEAMGWHGSSLMSGAAVGSPAIGLAIDRAGWPGAFVVAALIGVLASLAGFAVLSLRRTQNTRRAQAQES